MKLICASCHCHIRDIPSMRDAEPNPPVSHGICSECAEKLYGVKAEKVPCAAR